MTTLQYTVLYLQEKKKRKSSNVMPSEDQSQPLAAPEKSLSGIALEAIIRRQEAAANEETRSAATTNKDTAAAATNKKDTAAAAATNEKKAANPFLNMFNDSMFTQELTETMEGGEGEGAHQNILDTSWGLKIEVRVLCTYTLDPNFKSDFRF